MKTQNNIALQQNAILPNNELSAIEKYNLKVRYNKKTKQQIVTKDPLLFFTIKHKKDVLQRGKLSDDAYNKEVEEFNNLHGLFIEKRVNDLHTIVRHTQVKYYDYINYPYISNENYQLAIKNYYSEVARWNSKIAILNKEIAIYNKQIQLIDNDNSLAGVEALKKELRGLDTANYNKEIDKYNATYGYLLKKRKYKKLKENHLALFRVLLGFFSSQLKSRNASKMNSNTSTRIRKSKVRKMFIRYDHLAKHTVDGVARLQSNKRTLYNWMMLFEEAGIIENYLFINSSSPIKFEISRKIVAINDGNPPKQQPTKNQPFKYECTKNLQNDSITTYSLLKRNKKRNQQNEKTNPPENGKDTQFYKFTHRIVSLNESFAPKNHFERSDFFKSLLVEPFILAQQLADNMFVNYEPIEKSELLKEAQYGVLSKDEYRTLFIYDIFKTHAKVYKNTTPYAVNWQYTIEYALENWFKNKDLCYNKHTIYGKVDQYRWMLNFAQKFYKRRKINPLYPKAYFDKSRTTDQEIGFFGIVKYWKKHLKYKNNKQNAESKRKYEANRRKARLSENRKITKKVKQYLQHSCTYDDLYNYVNNNFTKDWLAQLPKIINKNIKPIK